MQSDYAVRYRELYERHWWWRARERCILRELDRLGASAGGETILDIGCGDGLFFDQLRRFGEVAGLEADEQIVDPVGQWRDRIHVGRFDDTFQPQQQFSLILMLDVLEHLPDDVAALQKVRGLLAPGGRALITVPAFRALWTNHDDLNHHYTRYTRPSLGRAATAAGLRIDRARYLFQWTCPVKLAVRLKERLLKSPPQPPLVPAAPINTTLFGLSILEQALFDRVPAPFGSSLLAVMRPLA